MQYESEENSSDEEYVCGKRFIEVELPEDFDPAKVPTNGMEHLQLARYQVISGKSTVKSKNDFSKYNKNQTFKVEQNEAFQKLPQEKAPSESWQNKTLEEFTKYREYVQHYLPKPLKGARNWKDKIDTEFPTIDNVSCLYDLEVLHLFELILNKLKYTEAGTTISDTLGGWLFAALSVVQIPISDNMVSVLRNISRECSLIRYNVYKHNSALDYTPLNVFICVIGRYLGQFDLADSL